MADEQAAYEAGPSEYAAQDDDASGQSEGEITSEKDVILEQDRLLPLANIGRIMKNVLPDNGKLSKEAKETMQECVSEFLLFIASEASDICTDDSRKTLSGDDIIQALAKLGFDNYVAPASAYLRKYREATNGKSADDQPTVPATAVYASVSEPVEYAADPKFQHHPQHPQHAQHVQHHILAAGGDQHPQAISLPQHLLQQQQYVPHMQQFQPMPYSVGVQHVQPPTVAGSSVVDPAAVSGTSMAQFPLIVSERSAFDVVGAECWDVQPRNVAGDVIMVLPVDNAAVPRPELREVHPPVQIYHDTQTNRHYLRVSEDNYVPIAFLSNEGAPPQFVAAGQPPPAMVPADVGHPMPPKLSRLAGSLGRSQRTDRRAGNSNVDAGPEQSVGSYLRRQQKEMNPKKRAGK